MRVTTIAALSAGLLLASVAEARNPGTIRVSGQGSVRYRNPMVNYSMTVKGGGEGVSKAQAHQQMATASQQLRSAIGGLNLRKSRKPAITERAEFGNASIRPIYRVVDHRTTSQVIGYKATQQVNVRMRSNSPSHLKGKTFDLASSVERVEVNGFNAYTPSSVMAGLRSGAEAKAAANTVRQARQAVKSYNSARKAGFKVKLGQLLKLDPAGGAQPQPHYGVRAMAMESAAAPQPQVSTGFTRPGIETVSAGKSAIYGLQKLQSSPRPIRPPMPRPIPFNQ
jgi:uncharacterized protein YggE